MYQRQGHGIGVGFDIVGGSTVVLLMAETESDYSNHASVTSVDSGHDIANTSINTLSLLPLLPLPWLLSLAKSQ